MKTLFKLLTFLALVPSLFAQVSTTTMQPLARDPASFNLNRNRLDFGSGQNLRIESGATLTISDGAVFSFGATAAADFAAALSTGAGVATFANTTARNAFAAGTAGQLGVQLDDGSLWRSGSATAGDWSGAFGVVTLGAGNGTASLPSLTFSSDTNTGFYRVGSDQLGVTIGGTKRFEFNASQIIVPDGAELTPSIAFSSGGNDAGLYYASVAEQLKFVAGGVTSLTVGNDAVAVTGDLEVGTLLTAPNYAQPLLVSSGGTAATPALSVTGDTDTGIAFTAANTLAIATTGTARVTVTDATTTVSNTLSLTTPLPLASGGLGAGTASGARDTIAAHSRDYVKFKHTAADGTAGGTATSGSWQTRTINQEVADTAGLATLNSNEITLQPGTYRYMAKFIFGQTGGTQLRLYDATAGAVIETGNSHNFNSGGGEAFLDGRFTLATATAVRVDFWCATTVATTGQGTATAFAGGEENYGSIIFERE